MFKFFSLREEFIGLHAPSRKALDDRFKGHFKPGRFLDSCTRTVMPTNESIVESLLSLIPKSVLHKSIASFPASSAECHLVRPSSISSVLSFPKVHPVVPYVFFFVFPSLIPSLCPLITCFTRPFLRKMWPIQLAFLLLIVCRIFLSSLTLCCAFSFLMIGATGQLKGYMWKW